jgi:hypothetical protein
MLRTVVVIEPICCEGQDTRMPRHITKAQGYPFQPRSPAPPPGMLCPRKACDVTFRYGCAPFCRLSPLSLPAPAMIRVNRRASPGESSPNPGERPHPRSPLHTHLHSLTAVRLTNQNHAVRFYFALLASAAQMGSQDGAVPRLRRTRR